MTLPEPYASWFEAVTGAAPPDEPLSTCSDCVMCARGRFVPEAKCCGYVPTIPNFRVGAALIAGGPVAERVRSRMASAPVTEHWLLPTPAEAKRYDTVTADTFGTTDNVVCPFYSPSDGCGIWRYRNATCATWFCRFEKGGAAQTLWDAVLELFVFAEGGVAVWCAADTFEESTRRAERLSWADIRVLGGAELAAREAAVREAWRGWRGAPDLPADRVSPPEN